MGVGGTLDYLSDLMSSGHQHLKKKKKQLQTVELKVRMDCDGCELKVKKTLSSLSGVKSVEINRKQQKVTVTGFVEPNKVLKKAKSTGKKAEIWHYVPYNLVGQPYAVSSYDKRAPPGYVRRVENAPTTGNHLGFDDTRTHCPLPEATVLIRQIARPTASSLPEHHRSVHLYHDHCRLHNESDPLPPIMAPTASTGKPPPHICGGISPLHITHEVHGDLIPLCELALHKYSTE